MKTSFVSKVENQARFIKAFVQEDRHPVPKPMRRILDKTLTRSLHSLPPTGTKTDFKSQVYSPSSLPLSFPRLAAQVEQESTEERGENEGVCPRV